MVTPPTVKIRQIYFEDYQKDSLNLGFVPYKNNDCDKFMENSVLKKMWRDKDFYCCNYYGVLSWRFNSKTQLDYDKVINKIYSDDGTTDVFSFYGEERNQNIFIKDAVYHGENLPKICNLIFEKLGYKDVLSLKTPLIYCNYWIAKASVFDKYMSSILIPAMQLMEDNSDIKKLVNMDSGYFNYLDKYDLRTDKVGNDIELAIRIFGVPYYTFHPFVCERLMSIFMGINSHLKLTNIAP